MSWQGSLVSLFSQASTTDFENLPITRNNLIQAQAEDASLKVYFNIAVSEVGLLKGTGYYVK